MKGIFCKLCGDLFFLRSNLIRKCTCENAQGVYFHNGQDVGIDVTLGDWSSIRIVGIDNNILQNDSLPPYHANPVPDGLTFFEQWGSAIIVLFPGISNDVYKLTPDRHPEVQFWTEINKKETPEL